MKFTKLKIFIAVVIVAVCAMGAYWILKNPDTGKGKDTISDIQAVVQSAKLTVSEDKKIVSYEGQTGKTALSILQSLANVTTQSSSYGEFVTGINGIEANGKTEFWSFYVNGKMASEGAGTYKTTNGEKIEWRIEEVL
jgi:hypothetical protein